MTTNQAVKLSKTDKAVKALLTAAFPDYRGRKLTALATETMTVYNLNWCEGSRNTYVAIDLATIDCLAVAVKAPWKEDREGATFEMKRGIVIAERMVFCGRECGVRFYLHPEDAPRVLAAGEKVAA